MIRPAVCVYIKMQETIEAIKEFAAKAHEGQKRKYSPEPYIVHPVRVMEMCRKYNNSTPVLAAALLHDVLEDTAVTETQLHDFLCTVMSAEEAKETMRLVIELTDVYIKDNYPQWNRRKRKDREASRIEKTSADAQTIKYADIIDNCPGIVKADPEFGPRFLKECKMLLQRINKGNQALYQQAKEIVQQNLRIA